MIDFSVLDLDCEIEAQRTCAALRELIVSRFRRRGALVAVSGGIDSAVCAALAARALGPERVFALLMPELDSSPESLERGLQVVRSLGIAHEIHDLSAALEALGCYEMRDHALRAVIPRYGAGWRQKIVIRRAMGGRANVFYLVARDPSGHTHEHRLRPEQYLAIVAATNFKQRVRKTMEYCHADRLNYAVIGTPNRLEYDQGFFVKNGDGAADVKPIAHLYKTQVYALARHLGLPAEILAAQPTTDTYSLAQDQDEFYFSLPYRQMDLALWAHNHCVSAEELAHALDMEVATAEAVYRDIEAKRRTTAFLHAPPVLLSSVPEVGYAVG